MMLAPASCRDQRIAAGESSCADEDAVSQVVNLDTALLCGALAGPVIG